ncbi:MAG: type IV pilus modification protein PilV [Gammaproteobacteria bacterium]
MRGFTLLEVLITLIILAIGMLGLANLQSKIHVTEIESYQRAHAVLLLQDMIDRINTNRGDAATYADAEELGYLSAEDCADATLAGYPAANRLAHRDRCQWSEALQGASEQRSGGGNAGGMIAARGCIEQVQAPNPATGVCTPGIYRVTVAWQGLHQTAAPALECGKDDYDSEAKRRAISTTISIGLPRCSSS